MWRVGEQVCLCISDFFRRFFAWMAWHDPHGEDGGVVRAFVQSIDGGGGHRVRRGVLLAWLSGLGAAATEGCLSLGSDRKKQAGSMSWEIPLLQDGWAAGNGSEFDVMMRDDGRESCFRDGKLCKARLVVRLTVQHRADVAGEWHQLLCWPAAALGEGEKCQAGRRWLPGSQHQPAAIQPAGSTQGLDLSKQTPTQTKTNIEQQWDDHRPFYTRATAQHMAQTRQTAERSECSVHCRTSPHACHVKRTSAQHPRWGPPPPES